MHALGRALSFPANGIAEGMTRVWFEGLPDYATPGGTVAATLGLEATGIARATDLRLYLHGAETSQVTVGSGKSRRVVVQRAPILELVSSFHDALQFRDADHIGPGTYRFPFRFDIPATAEPSLATEELPRNRPRFMPRPDGLYVEYELEARLTVPWWIDPVDREIVPIYSPRRVLGALPPFSSQGGPDRPTLQVHIDPPMVLPDTTLTGGFAVENPELKELGQLTLTLLRHVEYRCEGYSGIRETPQFTAAIRLGTRSPHSEGPFQIAIPNVSQTTGPFTGQLYRTYWVLRAELEVHLGFNVKVDAVFTPA